MHARLDYACQITLAMRARCVKRNRKRAWQGKFHVGEAQNGRLSSKMVG